MKQYSDEELVRFYLDTQRNSYFEALYSRYCDKVYRKCYSFTKSQVKAEDLTHDIFLRLITKLPTFKEEAKFSTWLYSVTYNYCMDQIRSKKNVEVYAEDAYEKATDYSDEEADTAELAEMSARGLQKALEQLSPEDRTLLLMKYQDGISIRDIANVQGVSEGTIKMRLLRSREKLRKRYMESVIFWVIIILKLMATLKWPFRL